MKELGRLPLWGKPTLVKKKKGIGVNLKRGGKQPTRIVDGEQESSRNTKSNGKKFEMEPVFVEKAGTISGRSIFGHAKKIACRQIWSKGKKGVGLALLFPMR